MKAGEISGSAIGFRHGEIPGAHATAPQRATWQLVDVRGISREGELKRTHRHTALSEMSSATEREAGA